MKLDAVDTGSTVRALAEPPEFLQRDNPRLWDEPIAVLSEEIAPWHEHNFPSWMDHPHQKVLGMTEELGELAEAIEMSNRTDVADAVGDIVVYMAAYCATQGTNLVDIHDGSTTEGLSVLTVNEYMLACTKFMGKVSHGRLKTDQGIRGTAERHWAQTVVSLQALLNLLSRLCTAFDLELKYAVASTWAKVRRRDWQADRFRGASGSE